MCSLSPLLKNFSWLLIVIRITAKNLSHRGNFFYLHELHFSMLYHPIALTFNCHIELLPTTGPFHMLFSLPGTLIPSLSIYLLSISLDHFSQESCAGSPWQNQIPIVHILRVINLLFLTQKNLMFLKPDILKT